LRTIDIAPWMTAPSEVARALVLKPEPIFECIEGLELEGRTERLTSKGNRASCLLSARRLPTSMQSMAENSPSLERIVLDLRRHEGGGMIRVGQHLADRELSIGDYVLSGGELGAAVIVDAVTRLIPGALGNEASTRQESFTAGNKK